MLFHQQSWLSDQPAEGREAFEQTGIGIPVASCLITQTCNADEYQSRDARQHLCTQAVVHLHIQYRQDKQYDKTDQIEHILRRLINNIAPTSRHSITSATFHPMHTALTPICGRRIMLVDIQITANTAPTQGAQRCSPMA